MQFNNGERKLILFCFFSSIPLGAAQAQELSKTGCVATPLSSVISEVHLKDQERLKEISRIAFENRICLAVETAAPDHQKASLEAQHIQMGQLLHRLFPDFAVEAPDHLIVSLRQNNRGSWLDYRVRLFRAMRASLAFNSHQLFFFLRDQVYPRTGGYAGSLSEGFGNNEVGPLTIRDRSVRDLLNTLIANSSEGGMWIVDHSYPRTEPLLEDHPFWKVLPYGGSLRHFLWSFEH